MNDLELKQLSKISNQFLKDLELLEKAFDFTLKGTTTFLEVASDDQILHHITLEYSIWVYCEFEQDKEKYYKFLNNYFKKRKPSGNTLFGWEIPNKERPNEEANRTLDRIDFALNFFKIKLDMEPPYELKGQDRQCKPSIRNGVWEQEKLLKRTMTFAKSASDLFVLEKDE